MLCHDAMLCYIMMQCYVRMSNTVHSIDTDFMESCLCWFVHGICVQDCVFQQGMLEVQQASTVPLPCATPARGLCWVAAGGFVSPLSDPHAHPGPQPGPAAAAERGCCRLVPFGHVGEVLVRV